MWAWAETEGQLFPSHSLAQEALRLQLLHGLSNVLRMPAAGAQYVLHDAAAVTGMCLVGGRSVAASSLVASCDASGALHVWSLGSGEQTHYLREAPGPRGGPLGQLRCRGEGAHKGGLSGLAI